MSFKLMILNEKGWATYNYRNIAAVLKHIYLEMSINIIIIEWFI